MCAINPKHHATVTFEVYTAFGTKEEFDKNIRIAILEKLLEIEVHLNSTTPLRWHLKGEPTIHK